MPVIPVDTMRARTFIALPLSPGLHAALARIQRRLADKTATVRWVDAARMQKRVNATGPPAALPDAGFSPLPGDAVVIKVAQIVEPADCLRNQVVRQLPLL